MRKLAPQDLLTLEAYARQRGAFRSRVMAHKRERSVFLGEHVTLLFEDELTMRYQVQEMLRAERIFEPEGIRDELDTYNPLIPDGANWKATLLIEYADPAERSLMLASLVGVERGVWVRAAGCERVPAVADEDLERATASKTSAVHFLRFELPPATIAALRDGAALTMGVEHPAYAATAVIGPATRASLLADLDG